jgi:hypothetical protein
MSDRKIHWRCFHCGETFTKAQERWAREHFGDDKSATPACEYRLAGESALISLLRKQERELARYRAEDSATLRALYAMQADHRSALIREEERGYAKGLADGRGLAQEPSDV